MAKARKRDVKLLKIAINVEATQKITRGLICVARGLATSVFLKKRESGSLSKRELVCKML